MINRFVKKCKEWETALEEEDDPSDELDLIDELIASSIKFAEKVKAGENENDEQQEEEEEEESSDESDEEFSPDLSGPGSRSKLNHFLRQALPKFVDTLLDRGISDAEVRMRVVTFFENYIKLSIAYMPFTSHELSDLVRSFGNVFDCECKFYLRALTGYDEAEGPIMELPKSYATANKISQLFVHLLNYFGTHNGFDAIIERMNDEENMLHLDILIALVRPFYVVRKLMKGDFMRLWIPKFQDSFFSLVRRMKDQQLKEVSRKSFLCMIEILEGFLVHVMSPKEAGELVEKFRLELTLKYYASESLEKRLNALMEINDLIQMAYNKENKPTSFKANQPPPVSRWLTSDYLVEWISKNEILEKAFGNYLHHEGVKRTPRIFVLFATKGMLSEKLIDLLWDASVGEKQEALVETVYKAIEQISSHLGFRLLNHLVLKIQQVPVFQFDQQLLKLVHVLLSESFTHPEFLQTERNGLELLWDLAQDERVDKVVSKEALQILTTFLLQSTAVSKRQQYILVCMENISKATNIMQSLRLLKKLISQMGNEHKQVIHELENKFHLLSLLFQELVAYKSKSITSPLKSQQDVDNYMKQITTRLKFIEFIISHSELQLSMEHAQLLSDVIIQKAVVREEYDLGYSWFEVACRSKIFKDQDVVFKYLLTTRFPQFDLSKLTLTGLSYFSTLFLFVNESESKINSWNQGFSVLDFNLTGLDTLWNIILCANDQAVVTRAIEMLSGLYEKVDVSIRASRGKLHEDFLMRAMTQLHDATNNRQVSKIDRCLVLLESFVNDYEVKVLRKRKEIDESTAEVEMAEASIRPSFILSNNDSFFTQIFQLLDAIKEINPEAAIKLWQLAQFIPTNPRLLQSLRDFHQVPTVSWEDLLNIKSQFKFVYSLNVVRSILNEFSIKSEWSSKFVETGGLKHLYNSFMGSLEVRGNINCLEPLLFILSYFMTATRELSKQHKFIVLNDDPSILSHVEPLSFAKQTIETLENLSNQVNIATAESTQRTVDAVQHTVRLLSASLVYRSDILDIITKEVNLLQFIRTALLDCTNEIIRSEVAATLSSICNFYQQQNNSAPIGIFLGFTLNLLDQLPTSSPYSEHFFKMVTQLLVFKARSENDLSDFWGQLLGKVVQLLKKHPIVEKLETSETDQLIVGLINILCTVVQLYPHFKISVFKECIDEILLNCLFDVPTSSLHAKRAPPKCKTRISRLACYALLLELSKNCASNWEVLFGRIKKLQDDLPKEFPKQWNYSPVEEYRNPTSYVGLKNLGCTCYMNSLLQQLFMLPRFRRGLLAVPCVEKEEQESFVYQLQTVFAFLQESNRRFFNPSTFCNANKDYEGNPMDVTVQMDVDEYFNMLCEKIDEYVKNTPQKPLLHNIWGGKLTNQLICKGCPHRYERDDPCYTISLDIKNKSSILEALDLYVKGEMLERDNAYHCEKCNQKRDTLKRACIKTLPNTLILILKRFDFDFDKMRKVKVNDYCEFPKTLNMEPYTTVGLAKRDAKDKESKMSDGTPGGSTLEVDEEEKKRIEEIERLIKERPSSYYEYNLVGVLIHRGTSDSGHYYSFIKERATMDGREAQWLEFNDKIVKNFDINNLENECFGGTEVVTRWDAASKSWKEEEVEKSRNAYLLIYERKEFFHPERLLDPKEKSNENSNANHPTPMEFTPLTPQEVSNKVAKKFVSKLRSWTVQRKNEFTYSVGVPPKLYEQVWRDNSIYHQTKHLLDTDYWQFQMQLLKNRWNPSLENPQEIDENLGFEIASFTTGTFLDFIFKSKDRSILKDFLPYFKNVFTYSPTACRWFAEYLVQQDNDIIKMFLLQCTVEEVRYAFADFLVSLTIDLFSQAELEAEENSMNVDDELSFTVLSKYMLRKLYILLEYEDYVWHYYDAYFKFFELFAVSGNDKAKILADDNALVFFIRFFMDDEAANGKKLSKFTKAKRRAKISNFGNMASVFSHFVSRIPPENPSAAPPTFNSSIESIPLNEEVKKLMLQKSFLLKLLRVGSNSGAVGSLLQFLCYKEPTTSKLVINMLCKNIMELELESLSFQFAVALELLQFDDGLQVPRIGLFLDSFLNVMEEKRKLPKRTREYVNFLQKIHQELQPSSVWFSKNKDRCAWIQQWLRTHSND